MGRPRTRVVRVCQYCGASFEAHLSEISNGGGKFCSRSCATTYRNIHSNPTQNEEVRKKISSNHADVSGEKNPMFGRRGKSAPSYIDGRMAFKCETHRRILLASGVECKCAVCGATGKLDVHHLDGNHKNNDSKNLVWLCHNCHYTVAHKYARDSNGRFIGSALNKIR